MSVAAVLHRIGVAAPGLADWPSCQAILTGQSTYTPAPLPRLSPALLPPNERRRATQTIRLALRVAEEAVEGSPGPELGSVFASSCGDLEISDRICRALAQSDRPVSPTHFHNSVHNAPAGYWAIGAQCTARSTSLAAFDATFAAGLLEALVQTSTENAPTLLVAYDAHTPPVMAAVRSIPAPFAVAMLLLPEKGEGSLACISGALTCAGEIDTCCDPALETLRLEPGGARAPVARPDSAGVRRSARTSVPGAPTAANRARALSLSESDITRLIPHAGSMCLIGKVEAWDEQRILCSTDSHRDPTHPLRRNGRLSSVHAIEYAAQAMALHGALRDPGNWEGSMAYLVAARDIALATPYLDDILGSITIGAALLLSDDTTLVYGFELTASHGEIAKGRLTVTRAIEKERN